MLSTKSVNWIHICVIFFPFLSFSQNILNNSTFVTYSCDSIPKHSLTVEHQKVSFDVSSKGWVSPKKTIVFSGKVEKDTLYVFTENREKGKGVRIDGDSFVSQFANTRFYQKSKDILFHLESKRPYYAKVLVDSVLGDQTVYLVNQKILMSKRDSLVLQDVLDNRKFKAKEIKLIKGKEAIKTYGVLGLNGVIEIKGKYRKNKKGKQCSNKEL